MENLIFTLVDRGFGWNLVRNIFATLDSVAFFLFSKVMGLMFSIAEVTSNADLSSIIDPLQRRIYVILSIYMLFKVTISLITYVVNPDSMTDKSQGVGKLVQRIIIALVMLIFFPRVFEVANKLQADLIHDGTIPKIVLGTGSQIDDSSAEGIGTEIAYDLYNGTFIYDKATDGPLPETSPRTVEALTDLVNEPGGDKFSYKYGYLPLLGFALGIVLTIVTLSMCIDVAIRVFKLIILQIIAPIPILSYIDPKASKDGAFSKWMKMFVSVWLDLFMRLFTIYFVILIIEKFIKNSGDVINTTNVFVKIALVIGLLFFAKDAPKFIYDSLGIKQPERGLFAGMGNIVAAGAIGAGAVSGAISGFSASRLASTSNGQAPNLAKNIGAGLFGGIGGIATGIGAATSAKDHNARAVMEAMSKRNEAAMAAGAAGSTAMGRFKSTASRLLTGQTPAMRVDRDIAKMQAQKDALSNVKSRMNSEMPKAKWTKGDLGLKSAYGDGNIQANYKTFMAAKDAAAAQGLDFVEFEDYKGRSQIVSMEEANMNFGLLLKNNEDDYIQNAVANGDTVMEQLIDIAANTGATVTDRKSVTDAIDSLGIEITNAKATNETNKQNDRFAGKK